MKSKEAHTVQPERKKEKSHKVTQSLDYRVPATYNDGERNVKGSKDRTLKTMSVYGTAEVPMQTTKAAISKPSKHALQPSSKDNVPAESTQSKPPKSILKDTSAKYDITRLKARSPSPRRRISLQDRVDPNSTDSPGLLPELENDSPFPTIKKSPEKAVARGMVDGGGSPKKGNESPKRKTRKDLWMEMMEEPKAKDEVLKGISPVTTLALATDVSGNKGETVGSKASGASSGIQSLDVLELQSILRREVEKLRLDMVRQFVTFRSEIGQRWETEISHLRLENERLKAEIHELKEEQRKRYSTIPGWR